MSRATRTLGWLLTLPYRWLMAHRYRQRRRELEQPRSRWPWTY